MKKTGLTALALCVGSILLSGCAPLLIGGAVGTTAAVSVDRRTTGAQMSDEVMEKRINFEINDRIKTGLHLTVTCYNRSVLLTGEVASVKDRALAQAIAQNSLEVERVYNELAVQAPTSVGQRLSDTMLANKVRAQLISTEGVSINQMKVVVDRDIVYLMGLVSLPEVKVATNVASRVSGVKAVVNVFEVLNENQINERTKFLHQAENKNKQNNQSVYIN